MPYNPFTRTFGTVRRLLVEEFGVDRRQVRPTSKLADLVPSQRRPELWRALRRQGLQAPPLVPPAGSGWLLLLGAAGASAQLALWLQTPWALAAALPLLWLGEWILQREAVDLPAWLTTIEELVMATTSRRDHPTSGYTYTPREIEFKVRLIFAESLGLPLERVRRDSRIVDLVG
jgi:hypothetical protein